MVCTIIKPPSSNKKHSENIKKEKTVPSSTKTKKKINMSLSTVKKLKRMKPVNRLKTNSKLSKNNKKDNIKNGITLQHAISFSATKQTSKKKSAGQLKKTKHTSYLKVANILSAISELGKWAFFISILSMVVSTSGYPTKDSLHQTNTMKIKRTESRPKRFINLLTLVPHFIPSLTTLNLENYAENPQHNNKTKSKKTMGTPKIAYGFQEEDNSFETASHNDKVYKKWKLRNQRAAYYQNA